jgi:hypothetical protein
MPAKGFNGAHRDLQECVLSVVGDALCTRRKMAREELPEAVASIVRMLRPMWPRTEDQARLHKLCKIIDFRVMKIKGPGAVSQGGSGGAAGAAAAAAAHALPAAPGSQADDAAASQAPSSSAALAHTIAPASIFADAGRAALFPASQREDVALQVLAVLSALPVASSGYAPFRKVLVGDDGSLHSWAAEFIYDFFDYT